MRDSIIPVQIRFPGIWFLLDVGVKVSLDRKFLGKFSIKKGFNLNEHILPGEHTISTKIPIRASKQFPFELSKDTAMILTLSYSRTWGDFSGLEITEDLQMSQAVRAILEQDSEIGLDTAPEEWKELKEKDNDVEVADYCENGIWDIDGLRDDLKLMKEKLGKKVKPSPVPKAAAQRKVVKKRKVRKKVKRLAAPPDKSGGKSKSEELRDAKALLDDGIIDDAEFQQMKKEILGK